MGKRKRKTNGKVGNQKRQIKLLENRLAESRAMQKSSVSIGIWKAAINEVRAVAIRAITERDRMIDALHEYQRTTDRLCTATIFGYSERLKAVKIALQKFKSELVLKHDNLRNILLEYKFHPIMINQIKEFHQIWLDAIEVFIHEDNHDPLFALVNRKDEVFEQIRKSLLKDMKPFGRNQTSDGATEWRIELREMVEKRIADDARFFGAKTYPKIYDELLAYLGNLEIRSENQEEMLKSMTKENQDKTAKTSQQKSVYISQLRSLKIR